MIKNYVPAKMQEATAYELVFDDGRNNGFAFPCDENGVLLADMPEPARKNYEYCMAHPEQFERFNKVICNKWRYRQNATGVCDCGEKIELYNAYMGACECPHCGQWYNLFGQRLNPPDQWTI